MIRTTPALTSHEHSTLSSLIARATSALASATTAAEVLETRDVATEAYDAAKRMARLAKAKDAHDEVIAAVYRAQADALLIESQAKARLADEYDAAQERGEVRTKADNHSNSRQEVDKASIADIGLTHKQIHEARQIRDAEKAEPGITEKILNDKIAHGEEPTRAAVKKEIGKKRKAEKAVQQAEWNRQRNENKAKLPADVQASERAKADAIAARKGPAGLSDADRIAELEQANQFLEAEVDRLNVKLAAYSKLDLMYRDWTEGGWEQVVQAKDDTIAELQRTALTRIARESSEKVSNLNAMRGLTKKLDEAGKGRDIYIDLDEATNG